MRDQALQLKSLAKGLEKAQPMKDQSVDWGGEPGAFWAIEAACVFCRYPKGWMVMLHLREVLLFHIRVVMSTDAQCNTDLGYSFP